MVLESLSRCLDLNEFLLATFIGHSEPYLYSRAWPSKWCGSIQFQALDLTHGTKYRRDSQVVQWGKCACDAADPRETRSNPWSSSVGKMPRSRKLHPAPVFLLGKFHELWPTMGSQRARHWAHTHTTTTTEVQNAPTKDRKPRDTKHHWCNWWWDAGPHSSLVSQPGRMRDIRNVNPHFSLTSKNTLTYTYNHGVGRGNSLQRACLENSTGRRAWWATVPGVTKSRTRPNTSMYMHTVVLVP